MTLRDWLRKAIGWDEMKDRLDLKDAALTVLVERVAAQDVELGDQRRRIDILMRRRDTAAVAQIPQDWEAEQIAFLNNPKNFEEV